MHREQAAVLERENYKGVSAPQTVLEVEANGICCLVGAEKI
jgi:hypothetical protein